MLKRFSTIAIVTLSAGWLAACAQQDEATEGGATIEDTEIEEPAAESEPDAPTITGTDELIVANASAIAFQEGPPSLPAGSRFAVLEGDPTEAEPLTFRLKFPADYEVPPHWHHVIEHVTVISGTLHLGMGDTMDKSQGTALGPGDFSAIPVEMTHYAWTGDEPVEFQLHSVGPWGITYVNPDDDPRNAPETATVGGN